MKKFIINEKKESDVITCDFTAIQHFIIFDDDNCDIRDADCCIDCHNAEVAKFVYSFLEYKVPAAFAANIYRIYLKKSRFQYLESVWVDDSNRDILLTKDYTYTFNDGVLFINVIENTYYSKTEEEK